MMQFEPFASGSQSFSTGPSKEMAQAPASMWSTWEGVREEEDVPELRLRSGGRTALAAEPLLSQDATRG